MNAAMLVRIALLAYPASFRREFGGAVIEDHETILRETGLAAYLRGLVETFFGGLSMRAEGLFGEGAIALRRLSRHPGFAFSVIATFAIGVGVNVAVFSVLSALVFAPTPLANISRLALVTFHPPGQPDFGVLNGEQIGAVARAPFTQRIAAYFAENETVGGPARTQVYGIKAYPGSLQTLGIRPELGSAAQAGLPGSAAISDEYWRAHLGADSSVIGSHITIDGRAYRIAAVLPARLALPGGFGREIPFQLMETIGAPAFLSSKIQSYVLVVQYKRGWPIADVDRMTGRVVAAIPTDDPIARKSVAHAFDLRDAMLGPEYGFYAWSLFWAVTAVLVIACANAATLVLAFTLTRSNEFALRAELGAGRRDLLRQLCVEAALLAIPGSIAGIGVAEVLVPLLGVLLFSNAYNIDRAHVDAGVLAYALALAVVATFAAAMAPYAYLARRRSSSLRGAGVAATVRGGLVIAEIACAFALVFSTVLLTRDVIAVVNRPLGIDSSHVAVTSYPFDEPSQANAVRATADAVQSVKRLAHLPGVTQAAVSVSYPLSTTTVMMPIGVWNHSIIRNLAIASVNAVSPAYFSVLGIPIVRGRAFTDSDLAPGAEPVAIVGRAFAERYLRGLDPIGRQIQIPAPDDDKRRWSRIVGVAGTVHASLTEDMAPTAYLPYNRATFGMFFSLVRGTLPAPVLARELGAAAYPRMNGRRVDTETFAQIVAYQTREQRAIAELFGGLALVSLILAFTGIYGVIAFSVRRRTREFGIRIALGASGASILRSVLHRVIAMTVGGVGIGLVLAAFAQRLLAPHLYIVKGFDLPTLLLAAVSMLGVALVAGIIPARRAVRIDPSRALRYE